MSTSPTPARITDIIHFHGLTLMVYSHEGVQYVAAKPLVDLAGIDWRNSKKSIQDADNAILYGTTWLNLAENTIDGGDITPKHSSQGGLKTHEIECEGGTSPIPLNSILCFRLDRARMFLARINTSRMKSHGNIEAAEALLKLQVEWAQVLHDYETKGFASKGNQRQQQGQLIGLMKARTLTKSPAEQHALTQMIHHLCLDMGYPIAKTPDLFSQN